MRLSKLLIGILLFIGSATYAQHSPQDTLTAYYYRYPQQAIKDAEALYRQAIKNNDTPLLIKSLILKTTFTLAIDHEDYPAPVLQGSPAGRLRPIRASDRDFCGHFPYSSGQQGWLYPDPGRFSEQ